MSAPDEVWPKPIVGMSRDEMERERLKAEQYLNCLRAALAMTKTEDVKPEPGTPAVERDGDYGDGSCFTPKGNACFGRGFR